MPKSYIVKLPGRSPVTLTAAGFCAPCEAATLQSQTAAIQATYQINVEPVPGDAAWEGPLIFENQFTGDGRFIESKALSWEGEQFPMPLRYAPEDIGAHGGAQVIGLINSLERRDDGSIWGTGIIDTSTELGLRVFNGLQKGTIKGVSADLDSTELEIRLKAEILEKLEAEFEAFMEVLDGEESPKEEKREVDENGYVKVAEFAHDDEVMYITASRFRAATLVDIPAFAGAYVSLIEPETVVAGGGHAPSSESMVAAAAPVAPPAAWFDNPGLSEPTPITITDDGRIYGHVALWGTCHTGFASGCVTPPASRTNYAWFRTGALMTSEGTEVAVGKVTMGTGHAGTSLSAAPAVAHYDDTGTVAADVASGEDTHGIWISGALRPGLTDEQLRELRAAPMSGDWRSIGGNLELCAMLAVNMPGFPVPRTRALVAGGATQTLLNPVPEIEGVPEEDKLSLEEFREVIEDAKSAVVALWSKEVGV